MQHHGRRGDQQRHDEVEGGPGEEEGDERDHRQHPEHEAVPHGPAEQHERLVAEEVEAEPGDGHDEEHDEGDRVPEEAEEDDDEDDEGVVHAEVGEVGAEAEEGLAGAGGEGEGVPVDHLLPRAAGGQGLHGAGLGVGDELDAGAGGGDGAVARHDLQFPGEEDGNRCTYLKGDGEEGKGGRLRERGIRGVGVAEGGRRRGRDDDAIKNSDFELAFL